METSEILPDILKSLATQSPVILVCFTGFAVVVVRWRSLGTGALPSLLGFGFAVLLSLASPILWAILPRALHEKASTEMSSIFTAVGVAQSVCWALALALLVLGISMGRSQTPPRIP